jgi:glutamine synthetase
MAGALASGLYGIKNKLQLKQAATRETDTRIKQTIDCRQLDEATKLMKKSAVAAEILGTGFTDHFTRTREWEWRQHLKTVTDWELKRYFEII